MGASDGPVSAAEERTPTPRDAASRWAVAWSAYAVTAVVFGLLTSETDVSTRLVHAAYALAHGLVLAVATGWIAFGLARVEARFETRVAGAAWFCLAFVVVASTAHHDLAGPARRVAFAVGLSDKPMLAVLVLACAAAIPAILAIGRRLSDNRTAQSVALLAPVAAALANHLLYGRRLPGAHLWLAWGAASITAGVGLPFAIRRPKVARPIVLAHYGLLVVALLVPAPLDVRSSLAGDSSAVLSQWVARLWPTAIDASADVDDPWWHDRSNAPPVAPTQPRTIEGAPIVVVLSVDALRHDILDDARPASKLPTLAQLRREAIEFSAVWSPGTQTVYALTSVFSGKYYSQLYWAERTNAWGTEVWPHEDPTPRFPALLSSAGVRTVNIAATPWLSGELGVVAGFSEDVVVTSERSVGPRGLTHWAGAADLADALIERLDGEGPALYFAHFLDPHHPYDQAGEDGPPIARYVAELAIVDAQIGRIRQALHRPELAERAVLIVTADHGEAFGEHGVTLHATTLYEEALRVPLWIELPGGSPRRIDVPASLMDLGPTILDLFGVPTPGSWMGESLLGVIAGDPPAFTRPIAAETRGKQALIDDGTKVILDAIAGTAEVYALELDPAERTNLAGRSEQVADDVARAAAFFDAHRLRREGYELRWRQ